jgi:glycosyltransferase involved in cell wall biosynthesis
MRVLFLTKYDSNGPSSRYRSYNYKSYLEDQNISCDFDPLLGNGYINAFYNKGRFSIFSHQIFSVIRRMAFFIKHASKYDLIVIEKELLPNIPFFIERILLKGHKYSLDFDDYIAASYKQQPIKKLLFKNKIDHLAKGAKFVTVGNRWYFTEIKSRNLIYLPTVINLDSYPKCKFNYQSENITLVWIGSLTTVKFLGLIGNVLKRLSSVYNITLKVIGGEFKLDGINVVCTEWNASTEYEEIISSDIGIMPLENNLFARGKCGFKLIQYMACGLPVVASALPANIEIVGESLVGYIADDDQDWFEYLEKLILDESLRRQLGEEGRRRIETKYSYQVWGEQYAKMIKDANS